MSSISDQDRIQAENEAWAVYYAEQAEQKETEEDYAWSQYYELLDREAEEAFKEPCPCSHTHDEHYGEHGHCEVHGCDCEYFGQDPQEYEIYTQVSLGDPNDPMSFKAYE